MKSLAIAAAVVLALAGCASNEPSSSSSGTSSSASVGQQTRDAMLTARVKTALAADTGLNAFKIDVDSAGTTVTLKGAVDNADLKRRAEDVARKVDGVATVKNELRIKGS